MPVYLDETTTNESNPHIINFAVFSDTLTPPATTFKTFKLKPIHIEFKDFEKLFFKKRKTIYTVAKLCFLNALLNMIKPKLSRLLHDIHCVSNKTSILLNKELFDLVLEDRIKSRVALTHANFVRAIDTTNDTYVRITISLAIMAISSVVNIEFIFKVRNIPAHDIFDADDLLNNAYNVFNNATHDDYYVCNDVPENGEDICVDYQYEPNNTADICHETYIDCPDDCNNI